MGVSVRETMTETRMETVTVTANSRRRRPTSPPMNSRGMNTATSDRLIERTVKPISPAPFNAAWRGGRPPSMCRSMFSITTMASSTTKPTAMVSPMSERLSRL